MYVYLPTVAQLYLSTFFCRVRVVGRYNQDEREGGGDEPILKAIALK